MLNAELKIIHDPKELTLVVETGEVRRLVFNHTKPDQSTIRITLHEGAELEVAQIFTADAFVELQIEQAAKSRCKLTTCQCSASDAHYHIDLNGVEAYNELSALFFAQNDDHTTFHLRTNHHVPDCASRSLVKGVASGSAKGEFSGMVYVAPDAQRTDARQQSRNILLSTTARIDTKPQLEIYADDVRCSHGATVGQQDDDAILYMRQRGLSEQEARRLQIEGFVGEIISHCTIPEAREIMENALSCLI
jgi:Fe-S cluster assembly protein SufD